MENKKLMRQINKIKSVRLSNPLQAYNMFRKLMSQGKKEGDEETIAYADYYLGETQFYLGSCDKLMKWASKAVIYFKKTDNYIMVSKCYNLMGIAYSSTEEFQLALDCYMNALDVGAENGIKLDKSAIVNNQGIIYLEMGDVSTAMKYFEKSYRKLKKKKERGTEKFFNAAINLADAYCYLEDYEQALVLMNEIMGEEPCMLRYLDDLLVNVQYCKIFYGKREIETGNEYFEKIMEMLERDYDTFDVHAEYVRIVHAMMDLGELDRAERLVTYLKEYAAKNNLTLDWVRVYQLEVRYFRMVHDEEGELKCLRRYKEMMEKREEEQTQNQLMLLNKQMHLRKTVEKYKREAEQIEEMRLLSQRDPLTGLLNRHSLNQLMEKYFKIAQKEKKQFGCIFLDVDCFKEYNDTYGHVMGDHCLQQVAEVCKNAENENCFFSRYGGDEFFAVITGETNEAMKKRAFSIMRELREQKIEHKNSRVVNIVTVSMGLLNMNLSENNNIIDVVNFSDKALYHAKENGRNGACFYYPSEGPEGDNKRFECLKNPWEGEQH